LRLKTKKYKKVYTFAFKRPLPKIPKSYTLYLGVNELVKNRIYLDNCCLNRPYDDLDNLNVQLEAEAKLFIQIEAERFVMLMQKETFDYTKWQENLFEDMTIEEIYNDAAKLRNENKNAHLM
jgi:hypothetical protein